MICVSLAVVRDAHGAAAMRGARDASGQIVVGTGAGPGAIYVDSDVQPVPAPHYCPDCVMHLLDAGLPVQQALPIPARPVLQDLTPDRTVLIPVSCGQYALARGPPISA